MLKAVFFDLDGTLLPMNEEEFIKVYFSKLYEKVKSQGYNKELLINTIWQGTKKMYENDGKETNEKVFWNEFTRVFGVEKLNDKALFDDFYLHEFKETKSICGENELAKTIVEYAKNKIGLVILSTNPIFPKVGTITRMGFVGLREDDFDYVTTYENSSYSKPNPKYFISLLDKFKLKPEEVILFGNNDVEDYMCAKKAGIDCYLVGENLILHKDLNIDFPYVKMNQVIDTIDKEFEKRK